KAADVAALAQVLCVQDGVAVEPPQHVGDIAIDMVHEPISQGWALRPGKNQSRMDPLVPPALRPVAKQPGMSRPPERGAPTPAHQPLADIIVDRDEMPGGIGGC